MKKFVSAVLLCCMILLASCSKGPDASSSGTLSSTPSADSSHVSSDVSESPSSDIASSETVSSKENQSQTGSKTSFQTASKPNNSSVPANIKVKEPVYDTKLELPIGLFAPQSKALFEKQQVSAFTDMKEMGATVCLGTYPGLEDKMLDWAQEAGMKVQIYDGNVEYSTPEQAVAYVNRYKDHPAYYGIAIADEPSVGRLEGMSEVCKAIRKADPDHPLWVNLLPIYAGYPSIQAYEDYIDLYMEKVSPNVIMFDNYGVIHGDTIRDDFYLNSELFMERSRKYDVPMWTFAVCSEHGVYKNLTLEKLRWQVSNQLAAGSKGIQWITYGQPDPMFATPAIDANGNKTETYYELQKVNGEIKSYDHILMSLNHVGTMFWMDGYLEPTVKTPFTKWAPINKISGDPAVVGCFEDKDGNLAMYVANYSFEKKATTKIVLNKGYALKYNIWNAAGKKQYTYNNQIEIALEPGEGKLIQLLK